MIQFVTKYVQHYCKVNVLNQTAFRNTDPRGGEIQNGIYIGFQKKICDRLSRRGGRRDNTNLYV